MKAEKSGSRYAGRRSPGARKNEKANAAAHMRRYTAGSNLETGFDDHGSATPDLDAKFMSAFEAADRITERSERTEQTAMYQTEQKPVDSTAFLSLTSHGTKMDARTFANGQSGNEFRVVGQTN